MKCLLLAGLFSLLPTLAAGESLRIATVTAENALVVCAPGKYPTGSLPAGTELEIYAQQADWCAIRPPAGSHCWVLAAHCGEPNQELAEVKQAGTPVWIGSEIEPGKAGVSQLSLKAGETIEILDSKELAPAAGETPQLWYKITPPAGEFRFIRQQDLTFAEIQEIAQPHPETPPAEAEETPIVVQESGQAPREFDPGSEAEPLAQAGAIGTGVRQDFSVAPAGAALALPGSTLENTSSRPAAPEPAKGVTGAELDALEVELSLTVAQDPSLWKLNDLKQAAASALARAQTPLGRSRAQTLLTRIEEFDRISQGAKNPILAEANISGSPPSAEHSSAKEEEKQQPSPDAGWTVRQNIRAEASSNEPGPVFSPVATFDSRPARIPDATPASATEEPALNTAAANPLNQGDNDPQAGVVRLPLGSSPLADGVDPRFDGVGWLMPVHSEKRAAPLFALIDKEGNILQYITASPGLNLHRYLKQEIGVYGQRGYLNHLKAQHVTVQRVVVLDRHRR